MKAGEASTVATSFAALGDPTRIQILEMLRKRGPLTITDISAEFSSSRQAITKHLNTLNNAELIRISVQGNQKISEIEVTNIMQVAEWMNRYDSMWSSGLARLKKSVEKKQ